MKITKGRLKQIINEELNEMLSDDLVRLFINKVQLNHTMSIQRTWLIQKLETRSINL